MKDDVQEDTFVVTSNAEEVPPVAFIQLTMRCRWESVHRGGKEH